jgi:adenylate cyclase class 2
MAGRRSAKREIEIKLRVTNLAALVADLRHIGVRSHGRVFESNTLYDTEQSDFRTRGCLLRLRTEVPAPSRLARGGAHDAVITWKAPVQSATRSRYKQKLEQEVPVTRASRWPQFLAVLGLRATFRYEKYRTAYHFGALHIDLDETPVGVFLELEGNPRDIDRVAQRLGFGPRDYSRVTYWDIYASECRRLGRVPRNMLFRRENSVKRPLFA